MLREFFDCWVAFHAIQRGAREDQERAAQRMVDASHSVKQWRAQQQQLAAATGGASH